MAASLKIKKWGIFSFQELITGDFRLGIRMHRDVSFLSLSSLLIPDRKSSLIFR